MPIRRVEDGFLDAVANSDFLYVANFEGHAGQSTNLEIGFAIGKDKPVYSAVQMTNNQEGELWLTQMLRQIKVATPAKVVSELLTLNHHS